ncbi:hypothetical protein PAXRUDRAFT_821110 [Paxillus rubicundulus Ve08.2h10]|uniref:Uncharacterized protein n=1 Tax=Paxillus rubicundulus Ve08.2h10 TaxID=930991 RepID=A0A0D0DPD8_9AGAM|nr:hypothetical protein PAXRUDRAFT_821110 [Paxillus rubicundulus Ve08.2h10]
MRFLERQVDPTPPNSYTLVALNLLSQGVGKLERYSCQANSPFQIPDWRRRVWRGERKRGKFQSSRLRIKKMYYMHLL